MASRGKLEVGRNKNTRLSLGGAGRYYLCLKAPDTALYSSIYSSSYTALDSTSRPRWATAGAKTSW